VALIQANIPQDEKWQDAYEDKILQRYREMTESALGAKLIVWPEAALPEPANNMLPYIAAIDRETQAKGSSLVMGVIRASDDGKRYYDSILALGKQASWYAKDHLVPFAEFFPVPRFVRDWLRLMSRCRWPGSSSGRRFATRWVTAATCCTCCRKPMRW
jgi:apolipoprotein N-acyltransferase